MTKVEEEFHAFMKALDPTATSQEGQSSQSEHVRWQKPTEDYVNANWDATTNEKKSMMGI